MPRIARVVILGLPHHVTQRGNRRERGEAVARLRLNTRTGRPAGGAGFVAKVEALIDRVLRPKPVGRPTKKAARDAK